MTENDIEEWFRNGAMPFDFSLVEFRAMMNREKAYVWDDGVIHGHNSEGRLIDKRSENPYEEL